MFGIFVYIWKGPYLEMLSAFGGGRFSEELDCPNICG